MDRSELELTQRKPHDHFSWGGLLRGVELASIDVLVVQTHSLRERKLTDLLHRLETLGVSFELIGQTGGFGGKLSRHEPNTRSKLNIKTESYFFPQFISYRPCSTQSRPWG